MTRLKRFDVRFYSDTPHGLVTLRNPDNPLFTAYVIPRDLLTEAKALPHIDQKGLYFLLSTGNEKQMYIGETRQGIIRLEDHTRKKHFWTYAVLFLSANFDLNAIHALEVHAIKRAREKYSYNVENDVTPKSAAPVEDLHFVAQTYTEIEFLLEALVPHLFAPKVCEEVKHTINCHKRRNQKVPHLLAPKVCEEADTFWTSRRGVMGKGQFEGKTFLVLAGSQIDLSVATNSELIGERRRKLVEQRRIKQESDGRYVLYSVESFSSPSAAAQFVLGGSVNGWVEWKNKDGKTLDQMHRKPSSVKD